jgi:uncharacterized protein (TIGR02001 family)
MTTRTKLLGAAGAAALALSAFAGAAKAEEPQFGWSAWLNITSDYIFRGISFTQEEPAFQPYLEFTYGIAYFGIWGSNIDTGDYGPWEVDLYAGIRPKTGPVSWDLGVLYYMYGSRADGGNFADDLDYVELQILATWAVTDKLALGGKLYYTPDQDIAITETFTVEGTVNYTLPSFTVSGAEWVPTIGGAVGLWSSESSNDYPTGYFFPDNSLTQEEDLVYWNAGLKIAVDKFYMDFRYWDTDLESDNTDERFLFSTGVYLP